MCLCRLWIHSNASVRGNTEWAWPLSEKIHHCNKASNKVRQDLLHFISFTENNLAQWLNKHPTKAEWADWVTLQTFGSLLHALSPKCHTLFYSLLSNKDAKSQEIIHSFNYCRLSCSGLELEPEKCLTLTVWAEFILNTNPVTLINYLDCCYTRLRDHFH